MPRPVTGVVVACSIEDDFAPDISIYFLSLFVSHMIVVVVVVSIIVSVIVGCIVVIETC